jgi:hypothetical protein
LGQFNSNHVVRWFTGATRDYRRGFAVLVIWIILGYYIYIMYVCMAINMKFKYIQNEERERDDDDAINKWRSNTIDETSSYTLFLLHYFPFFSLFEIYTYM